MRQCKTAKTLWFLVICAIPVSCGSPPANIPTVTSTISSIQMPTGTPTAVIDAATGYWWFEATYVDSEQTYQAVVSFIQLNGNLKGEGEISAIFVTGARSGDCDMVVNVRAPFEVYGIHGMDGFLFQTKAFTVPASSYPIMMGYYCDGNYQWGPEDVLQSIFDMKGKGEGGDVIATAAGYWSVSLGLQMTGIIHSCRFLPQDGYQVEETTEDSRIECTLHQGIMPTPTPYLFTVPTEVPAEPILGNADVIAGAWSGTVSGGDYSFQVSIAIGEGCTIGSACGPFDIPAIPCSGTLVLTGIAGSTYEFKEGSAQGSCDQDALWTLTLLPDGTLSCVSRGESWEEKGILKRKE